MHWDEDYDAYADDDGTQPPVEHATREDEPRHVESDEERRALLADLRAQIASGTYRPSIGRISVSLFSELASK